MKEHEARQPDYLSIFLKAKEEHIKKEGDITSFDPMTLIRGYEHHALKPLNAFVSRTRSMNITTRTRELVRYAFNKYNPPAFLYQVWDPEFKSEDVKVFPKIKEDYKQWFLAIVQGKSLYKEYAMGLLTKREVHFFTTCPYYLSLPEAVWYSVVLGMDEKQSTSVAKKIASTKLSREPLNDFWRGVARWFMQYNTASVKTMNDLMDYIKNRHDANPEWYIRDLTLLNLQKHMRSWHRELSRVRTMSYKFAKWDGIKVDDSTIERGYGKKVVTWKFHQITTGKELAEEGNRQHHCVSSYGYQCANGQCSIWSQGFYEGYNSPTRALTIEVRDKVVVQARGYGNRMPKADEMSVLKEWASKCGFRVRAG